MIEYKKQFFEYMGSKESPNDHEKELFVRAQKYISRITWIPWLRMVAVANSLAMYATHEASDIDLFVITAKNRIWIVRILMTALFLLFWVWRKGEDIAGNFCLSFFVEEDALDFSDIAIERDIYLYFWIYSLKPIYCYGQAYENFISENSWVDIESSIMDENRRYCMKKTFPKAWTFVWTIWKAMADYLNSLGKYFWEKKAKKNFESKGSPFGVIIRSNILKFHDNDMRKVIRESILHGR